MTKFMSIEMDYKPFSTGDFNNALSYLGFVLCFKRTIRSDKYARLTEYVRAAFAWFFN